MPSDALRYLPSIPFPEHPLRLRAVAPLWVADPEEARCTCGERMTFVASVGYEDYGQPSMFPRLQRPFFLGELAFYFFVCPRCVRVTVISQPT